MYCDQTFLDCFKTAFSTLEGVLRIRRFGLVRPSVGLKIYEEFNNLCFEF